mmetsp:Transcript_21524/g.50176  ORF Transcript_21524/g.50176 Transcript_21524/m.50176 type:complete len:227 (-) Transcript_21524:587-1267(-)
MAFATKIAITTTRSARLPRADCPGCMKEPAPGRSSTGFVPAVCSLRLQNSKRARVSVIASHCAISSLLQSTDLVSQKDKRSISADVEAPAPMAGTSPCLAEKALRPSGPTLTSCRSKSASAALARSGMFSSVASSAAGMSWPTGMGSSKNASQRPCIKPWSCKSGRSTNQNRNLPMRCSTIGLSGGRSTPRMSKHTPMGLASSSNVPSPSMMPIRRPPSRACWIKG